MDRGKVCAVHPLTPWADRREGPWADRREGPGSWCGEGGSAPFDPKSPFSFCFFNHPEEGNWVGLVSQSVKVLRVGGSNLTV